MASNTVPAWLLSAFEACTFACQARRGTCTFAVVTVVVLRFDGTSTSITIQRAKKTPIIVAFPALRLPSSALHRRDCCSSVELVCSDSRLQSEDQHREAAKSKKHWQREVGHATTLYYLLPSSIPAPKYCTDQSFSDYLLPTHLFTARPTSSHRCCLLTLPKRGQAVNKQRRPQISNSPRTRDSPSLPPDAACL
ncbi:hypothetical protein GQ607_006936 [Colletotrichum asianum]|uniref:Secreted protein n=1 Tax=Colletotrichum asianum TaxID=702518 RepID=A0A8H3WF07_9PEZI|nr:hypothetical protein GQ607_006936 [Colletotrichum asianum]